MFLFVPLNVQFGRLGSQFLCLSPEGVYFFLSVITRGIQSSLMKRDYDHNYSKHNCFKKVHDQLWQLPLTTITLNWLHN